MPPHLNVFGASRSLAIHCRASPASIRPVPLRVISRRSFVDSKDPKPATGPNQDVLGPVTEEAVEIGKVTSESVPDLGQSAPVRDVCQLHGLQIISLIYARSSTHSLLS